MHICESFYTGYSATNGLSVLSALLNIAKLLSNSLYSRTSLVFLYAWSLFIEWQTFANFTVLSAGYFCMATNILQLCSRAQLFKKHCTLFESGF